MPKQNNKKKIYLYADRGADFLNLETALKESLPTFEICRVTRSDLVPPAKFSPENVSGLNNLKDYSGESISPIDVDIDQKMNVFFIDGSQRIFIWNLYWNQTGIRKISVSASFKHIESGITNLFNSFGLYSIPFFWQKRFES